MGETSYAIALGSNRCHGRHGAPAAVILAAIDALATDGIPVIARSKVIATPPMGPAGRSFANAAVLVRTDAEPLSLLAKLKAIERRFGRKPGKHWGPRILDLDILLWSGSPIRRHLARSRSGLMIPHIGLAHRDFVLQPLLDIAPRWRHPVSGLTIRQLRVRLQRAKPVDANRPLS